MDYKYRAMFRTAVNGNTVRVLIDFGLNHYAEFSIRLDGVSVESTKQGTEQQIIQGKISRRYVYNWFRYHCRDGCGKDTKWNLIVETFKSSVFGNWNGRVSCLNGHCVNVDVIRDGYAKPFVRKTNG